MLWPLVMKGATVRFTLVYVMDREAHEIAARDLNAALASGALRPRIVERFPLDQIVEAHEFVGAGGAGGKVVVDIESAALTDRNQTQGDE